MPHLWHLRRCLLSAYTVRSASCNLSRHRCRGWNDRPEKKRSIFNVLGNAKTFWKKLMAFISKAKQPPFFNLLFKMRRQLNFRCRGSWLPLSACAYKRVSLKLLVVKYNVAPLEINVMCPCNRSYSSQVTL